MRRLSLYDSPFRIHQRADSDPEPDLGPQLNQTNALSLNGPVYAQPPGGLTRWMALPWQGDTAFCRSGYQPDYDPYLPTFWPARVPNQVLTEESYRIVVDTSRSDQERIAAYNGRQPWLRFVDGPDVAQVMQRMIDQFGDMGVIEARPGVTDIPELPDVMYVESLPAPVADELRAAGIAAGIEPGLPPPPTDPVARAGWISDEHLEAFRSVRVRHQ